MNNLRQVLLEVFGLDETILDKGGLMKAIFLTGGAGSGKSTILHTLFPTLTVKHVPGQDPGDMGVSVMKKGGAPLSIPSGSDIVTPMPKIIDSDDLFTKKLDVAELPQAIPSSQSTDPKDIELRQKQMDIRKVATNRIKDVLKTQLNGYYSVIIDGTGKNPENMKTRKDTLERLGYDTFNLIVDSDLETSQRRNQKRTRKLPMQGPGSVEEIWHQVQEAIPYYKELFGSNCYVAKNNDGELDVASVRKAVGSFLNSPIQNPIGQELLAQGKKGGSITRSISQPDIDVFEKATR